MALYFISDLHLQASHPKMIEGFLALVSRLKQPESDAEALYILGDFFEIWIGDDYEDAIVKHIKQSLSALSDSGVAVFFMHGNRDFLMGNRFAEECGGKLIDEGTVLTNGAQQVLLAHGDHLCTRDVEYMKLRQMIRNPEWQAGFLAKSIPERIEFAQHVRGESKGENSMKSNDIMDVTPEEVDKAMTAANVDLLIHGHTHRPKVHDWIHEGQARQRIVLGDWSDEDGWLIRWEKGESPDLQHFTF
ncbi:MAG: UDP-2,3-diacylglucosamine diphosphatase [Oleibacter sp.]|nr:UDP-2,3-diacylglucosamine diphosphatase [Thalassolituus sp.]